MLTAEQKIAFDKIPSAFVAHLLGFGASETAIIDAWNDALLGVKEQRKENGDLRKEQKEQAEQNAIRKRIELESRCNDLNIEVPALAKSLHRTDKKVGDKIPQILCGVKFRSGGVSGSLDRYIATGKGGKVTAKVEAKVKEAQNECLLMLAALAEAGFTVGDEEDEEA